MWTYAELIEVSDTNSRSGIKDRRSGISLSAYSTRLDQSEADWRQMARVAGEVLSLADLVAAVNGDLEPTRAQVAQAWTRATVDDRERFAQVGRVLKLQGVHGS